MNICLFGAASNLIDSKYLEAAEALGEALARRGHTLIYGAGATGLMGAAARGVKKVPDSCLIGIAPTFFDAMGVLFPQCDELIYTETMAQRKSLMESKADLFLMVPGGIGTFEEFFEVLTLTSLDQSKKPIMIYNICGYFDELLKLLKQIVKAGFADESILKLYTVYDNVEELLNDLKDGIIGN